ncbi:transposable element Tcb1 transposase [Trichonephila clavipes]|nr:transposable element Tcb1 transposase [Trichonephila clavipes]
MNPIEHVWDMLGRRIAAHQPPPTCIPELRRALLDEWCNILQDEIDNLIPNMPRRCIIIVSFLFPNARAWLRVHLTTSLPVTTGDVVSRVFIDSSALSHVVALHSVMDAEWACLVSSQAKPVDVYSQNVMPGGYVKVGNSPSSLQVPWDWAHSGQSFPWLSKALGVLGYGSIFVK